MYARLFLVFLATRALMGCCESRSVDPIRSVDGRIRLETAEEMLTVDLAESVAWVRHTPNRLELRVRSAVPGQAPAALFRFEGLEEIEPGAYAASRLGAVGCRCPERFGVVGEWTEDSGWTEYPLTCATGDGVAIETTADAPTCAPLEGTMTIDRWRVEDDCSRGWCLSVLDARVRFEVAGQPDDGLLDGRVDIVAADEWQVDSKCEGAL